MSEVTVMDLLTVVMFAVVVYLGVRVRQLQTAYDEANQSLLVVVGQLREISAEIVREHEAAPRLKSLLQAPDDE